MFCFLLCDFVHDKHQWMHNIAARWKGLCRNAQTTHEASLTFAFFTAISVSRVLGATHTHIWDSSFPSPFRSPSSHPFPTTYKLQSFQSPLPQANARSFPDTAFYLLQYFCISEPFNMCKALLPFFLGDFSPRVSRLQFVSTHFSHEPCSFSCVILPSVVIFRDRV